MKTLNERLSKTMKIDFEYKFIYIVTYKVRVKDEDCVRFEYKSEVFEDIKEFNQKIAEIEEDSNLNTVLKSETIDVNLLLDGEYP
jgi:hypothetical protein